MEGNGSGAAEREMGRHPMARRGISSARGGDDVEARRGRGGSRVAQRWTVDRTEDDERQVACCRRTLTGCAAYG